MKTLSIFKFFSFILLLAGFSYNQNINYKTDVLNNWACSEGNRQSPIKITIDQAEFNPLISILGTSYETIYKAVMYFNTTSKTVQIGNQLDAKPDNKTDPTYGNIYIDINNYVMKFDLKSIIVHTPSEHIIDGVTADAEVQLVHKKDLDFTSDINNLKRKPDINEYLVVSILYAKNGTFTDSNFLKNISEKYSNPVTDTSSTTVLPFGTYNLLKNRPFYFYKGAQTINPCNENHLYFVMKDIFTIDSAVLDNLNAKVFNTLFTNGLNVKQPVSLNDRIIYRNFFKSIQETNDYENPLYGKYKEENEKRAKEFEDANKAMKAKEKDTNKSS